MSDRNVQVKETTEPFVSGQIPVKSSEFNTTYEAVGAGILETGWKIVIQKPKFAETPAMGDDSDANWVDFWFNGVKQELSSTNMAITVYGATTIRFKRSTADGASVGVVNHDN